MESTELCETRPHQAQLQHCINLFSANTRSLKGKTEELSAQCCQYEIICLTETHLDPTFPNHQIFDFTGKCIYRKDRTLHGGGVLVAVDDTVNSQQIDIVGIDDTELIFVRINCLV